MKRPSGTTEYSGRDPKRIQRMARQIVDLWVCYPDMRLGQLLCNLDPEFGKNTWNFEDDKLEASLKKVLDNGGYFK
jgi:hypothetical protein